MFTFAINDGAHFSKEQLIELIVNVDHIKSSLFETWHWQMISNDPRNDTFAKAIEKALEDRPNSTVLDVGCGTGILSVIAARTR